MSNVKRQMSNSRIWGFTLLELLVSISIIGVLISLAAVSYSSAQKKSRDAKRQGDLKAIQNAFEQYYSCSYTYPTAMPAAGSTFSLPSSCGSTTLLEKVPSDPKTGNAYPTGAAFTATSYKVCADTEVVPTPYCVSNLQ